MIHTILNVHEIKYAFPNYDIVFVIQLFWWLEKILTFNIDKIVSCNSVGCLMCSICSLEIAGYLVSWVRSIALSKYHFENLWREMWEMKHGWIQRNWCALEGGMSGSNQWNSLPFQKGSVVSGEVIPAQLWFHSEKCICTSGNIYDGIKSITMRYIYDENVLVDLYIFDNDTCQI